MDIARKYRVIVERGSNIPYPSTYIHLSPPPSTFDRILYGPYHPSKEPYIYCYVSGLQSYQTAFNLGVF